MPLTAQGKRRAALLVGLFVLGLGLIAFLGRAVVSDLDALSTAQTDDISWNMAQIEVELLRLQGAARAAPTTADDLTTFRKRYDIFYSRFTTLAQSPLYRGVRARTEAQAGLQAVQDFLITFTPLVDGSDVALQAALPQLAAATETLHPNLRQLALVAIETTAHNDAAGRQTLSRTLVKLAAAVLALVLALFVAAGVLLQLYRRGQATSHENQVVKSRFEAAVASSLDAVLVVDVHGRIIEFNGAAETVFGYTRDEALGGDMADMIVPPHLRDMHRVGMQRYLDTGVEKVIGAGRIRLEGMRKSGAVFPVELSISLAETGSQKVFVSFLRDITSELEAEQDLRTARDKAQESEKAKSDLLTVMSHEMRTPLNGILGALSLLKQDTPTDRQSRYLNAIEVSGELLLSHVTDVLNLSSLDANGVQQTKTRFDLQGVVQSSIDSLSAAAEARNNTLSVTFFPKEIGVVNGYKTQLQQCLVNLVGNAIKFTKDGAVSVEVEQLPDAATYEFRVSDTGVGIAPDDLAHIFDEFFTVNTDFARDHDGTGLGLAITRRLVGAMGGDIDADSIPGEGSMFSFRIPLATADAYQTGKANAQDGGQVTIAGTKRALVVDDNDINRMILSDMLGDLGVTTVEAEDGFAAIKAIEAEPFDALFLDISMPGIDGLETLRRIRALEVDWNTLPAVAVTAHAGQRDHDLIRRESFLDLVVKPINTGDVHKTLLKMPGFADDMTATDQADTPTSEFEARFGRAKYAKAMGDMHDELAMLLDGLHTHQPLTDEIRAHAHKIAGSAAVLGNTALRRSLQALEGAGDGAWAEQAPETLRSLKTEQKDLATHIAMLVKTT
ncbi:PAS domain-containing hybrid sensor histidine kinase/response regulator [uncultured Tateyamaria sp.]|uniref:PAS domain-containing hybrid sensor histidine kinase/response regulator n=1 Tax=uncultured Tateyamaria sp. TaxID=455651 RepID=UPI00262EEAE8|nr:PAS domain-containing hybrid sensor histidine kinase/response regulator [uncultured Tateyamaria sp.]